jgi:hypothetical protein
MYVNYMSPKDLFSLLHIDRVVDLPAIVEILPHMLSAAFCRPTKFLTPHMFA